MARGAATTPPAAGRIDLYVHLFHAKSFPGPIRCGRYQKVCARLFKVVSLYGAVAGHATHFLQEHLYAAPLA
jgi:hypothetical protein